ncbi:MAG: hypothetical protein ISS33_03520 [Candidatus Omnitrophica bacterium]|nr:hypothetical protein [Candidatus Omnitrophota bacterium]
MAECKIEKNKEMCNCTYEPCARKGMCCECLHYHRKNGQLPACYFPNDIEKSFDRSIENFIKTYKA